MSSLLDTLPLLALMLSHSIYFSYIDKISDWSSGTSIAQGMGVPGYTQNTQYNVLSLGFINSKGPRDIAALWQSPVSYFGRNFGLGTTNDQIQRTLIQKYHEEGILLLVSAFGSTESPTTAGLDASETCTEIAQFVRDNHLDGVDIDWIDNNAMEAGVGERWIIECTLAVRRVLPIEKYYVIHSPQAPYFDYNFYGKGGYARVNYEVGHLINWYNVQYYNQGETKYDTYEQIFESSSSTAFPGTSVKELHSQAAVPLHKIVVCKPVTTRDEINTGWVPANSLGQWAEKARSDFDWKVGLATWEFGSDTNGQFAQEFKGLLSHC